MDEFLGYGRTHFAYSILAFLSDRTYLGHSPPVYHNMFSSTSYVGWRLFRSGSSSVFLPKAAKWTLVGCGGMIVLSGLILGIPVLQGEFKPVITVVQMTSEEEGTGLGLSIAEAIVEAHEWTISVTGGREGAARFAIRGVEKRL